MGKLANLADHVGHHHDNLVASRPLLRTLAIRVNELAEMLTQLRGTDLDAWITAARSHDLPALRAFTDGLTKDFDAAGLTLPYSTGPTEGGVDKIKMLKRQTYGKASFPLLRKRILIMD